MLPSETSASTANRSARGRVLAALLAMQKSDDPVDELLDRVWGDGGTDPRDRAFAMELLYGALRRQETLDWRLAPVLNKPLLRLPSVVQSILRLGAYQLLYMDRVPASAAVNESVNLAKRYAAKLGRDWGGFVNAVLRALLRTPEPAFPEGEKGAPRALSVRYGIPEWLCERWIAHHGLAAAEAACRTASVIPAVTLRVNRLRLTREELLARLRAAGIVARPTVVSPVGVTIEEGQAVATLPGFTEGWWYVEDEAAQLIPLILDPQPGERILDTCAAPGGKTTHLAELMADRGQIVALDRQAARLHRLTENLRRLGITIVVSSVVDVRELGRLSTDKTVESLIGQPALFDRILVDAPCSGIGVLRRHPDAKWKKDAGMFARHHTLQRAILERASAFLRPGGVLVYSTCSTEPEETECVIAEFCQEHQAFTRESVAPWLPVSAHEFVTPQGALSTMGNTLGMDGFYAVRMRKTAETA
ncbi:MAG: 16S rRNA (cytosine(967)-C(5))-methyltransferase RsmB [Nitrospira sp.]